MSLTFSRVSQQVARYTPLGSNAECCGRCRFYMAPSSCGRIVGPVSPRGWCKYYSREMVQTYGGSIIAFGTQIPAGATLDLSFMTPGTLDPRITFTRASTATYTDFFGVIQTAAVNAPRWDYTGGALRGLLIEEARTNVLLNSAALSTQGVAVTAQAYTLSFYGTGTITTSGAATGALVGTGAGQRVSQMFTPTAGTLTCTVTGSVLNAQLEAGSFVTSWIPTGGAAATRAQDQCGISPANMAPWFASPGGSWFAEFVDLTNAGVFVTNGGRVIGEANVAGGRSPMIDTVNGGVGSWDGVAFFGSGVAVPLGSVIKGATTWAVGRASACADGGVVGTSTIQTQGFGSFTTTGIRFMQPSPTPSDNITGYLRRVSYWPRALSDAEMQQVTT